MRVQRSRHRSRNTRVVHGSVRGSCSKANMSRHRNRGCTSTSWVVVVATLGCLLCLQFRRHLYWPLLAARRLRFCARVGALVARSPWLWVSLYAGLPLPAPLGVHQRGIWRPRYLTGVSRRAFAPLPPPLRWRWFGRIGAPLLFLCPWSSPSVWSTTCPSAPLPAVVVGLLLLCSLLDDVVARCM